MAAYLLDRIKPNVEMHDSERVSEGIDDELQGARAQLLAAQEKGDPVEIYRACKAVSSLMTKALELKAIWNTAVQDRAPEAEGELHKPHCNRTKKITLQKLCLVPDGNA